MRLGVAIVTHNSADVVAECLMSIDGLLPDASVCVADNDSKDQTIELVREALPTATVVRTGGNLGYASACNRAFACLERLGAEVVIVINPDVVLIEASSAGVLGAFADERVTHAAGEFRSPARSGLAAASPSWFEMLRYSAGLAVPREIPGRSLADGRKRRGVYASGALVAVRASAWRHAGGFDEEFFLYYEDRDFSERLQALGPVVALPALAGTHRQGTSSGEIPGTFALRAALSGWLLYVAKHEGAKSASLWCTRVRRAQIATAILLRPLAALGSSRAIRKRSELLELVGFLAQAGTAPGVEDPPSAVLALALRRET